jgi:hypothetical protein
MDISRRNVLKTAPAIAGITATGWMLQGSSCSTSTADDLTLVIGAAEGVLDIILPFIPSGSALVPIANSIATALSQVVTIWGGTGTNASKWAAMLTVLEAIPGEILTLSPQLQAIIAGVGAAINVIINVIKQLQAAPVVASVVGVPSARGISGLLGAIKGTEAKLAKL